MWNGEKTWIDLRSSLWFVPVLFVVGAIALAVGMVELDIRYSAKLQSAYPQFFGISADGARGILGAISSSTITVAGVIFSIVIVALSIAANQYTPRILRTFMRDRGTQSVLGVFVGVFTYSLMVLRTVRSGDDVFVPSLAISVAILLGLVSIGCLVYFIHHIASSIQAPTMIASIAKETIDAIKILFPETQTDREQGVADQFDGSKWKVICAKENGYLQHVGDRLAELAEELDTTIRIERKIGEFIIAGTPLLSVRDTAALDEKSAAKMLGCVAIDSFRTVEQDPSYGIRQLVDIAMKALSPGVNDTSTAINCIDYLGAILHVAVQREPMRERIFRNGRVRLEHKESLTMERLVDEAFMQIRQSGRGNPAVLLRLLKVIGMLASVAKRPEYVAILTKHIDLVSEVAHASVTLRHDLKRIDERITRVRREIAQLSSAF